MEFINKLIGDPLAITAIVGFLLSGGYVMFEDKLKGMSLKSLVPSGGKPDRKAALSSLDDAIAYLEYIKCREGVDSLKSAYPHFYHEHSEPA